PSLPCQSFLKGNADYDTGNEFGICAKCSKAFSQLLRTAGRSVCLVIAQAFGGRLSRCRRRVEEVAQVLHKGIDFLALRSRTRCAPFVKVVHIPRIPIPKIDVPP